VLSLFGLDMAVGVTSDEWDAAVRGVQKRHLLAHRMGVIDNEYVRRSGDRHAVAGRKVAVSEMEVRELADITLKLARHLHDEIARPLAVDGVNDPGSFGSLSRRVGIRRVVTANKPNRHRLRS